MNNNTWRARYRLTLSSVDYFKHAESIPGFFPVGIISRAGQLAGLAHDVNGNFFAVNGRAIDPLKKEKITAAMANASMSPSDQD